MVLESTEWSKMVKAEILNPLEPFVRFSDDFLTHFLPF